MFSSSCTKASKTVKLGKCFYKTLFLKPSKNNCVEHPFDIASFCLSILTEPLHAHERRHQTGRFILDPYFPEEAIDEPLTLAPKLVRDGFAVQRQSVSWQWRSDSFILFNLTNKCVFEIGHWIRPFTNSKDGVQYFHILCNIGGWGLNNNKNGHRGIK